MLQAILPKWCFGSNRSNQHTTQLNPHLFFSFFFYEQSGMTEDGLMKSQGKDAMIH
jgi:hypothetical protein